MISKKRTFKVLRLILCLAVMISASSVFFTVEPMASENEDSQVFVTETDAPVQAKIMKARSPYSPVQPHHLTLTTLDVSQSVTADEIAAALAALPAEEEVIEEEPIEEVMEEEIDTTEEYSDEIEEYDYEESEIDYEESYEEESYYEEESEESMTEDSYYEEESTYEEESSSEESEEESEVVEESTPESSMPAAGTYSDLDYLAAICQIEAGYSYDGCLAVANVVLNRLNAGFGSDVREVIYQSYQFATGWMDYYLENGTSSVAREAASAALAGSNNIGGYLYFNGTTWLDPETLDCEYIVIDGNVFY